MIYVGIDNGVTGSIALVYSDGKASFAVMPVKTEQSYTKKKQNITRIVYSEFCNCLEGCLSIANTEGMRVRMFVERPMVNPKRFKSSASALRSLEATQIALEEVGVSYEFIDSKQWQRVMLPLGIKGATELKKASMQVGKRLFPDWSRTQAGCFAISRVGRAVGLGTKLRKKPIPRSGVTTPGGPDCRHSGPAHKASD